VRAVVTLPSRAEVGNYLLRWTNDAPPTWDVVVPLHVLTAEQARWLT
jgi:hypothetical protein